MDCPFTERWREAIQLRRPHDPDNGMCNPQQVVIRLKGIWKTTGLTWKEQAKVKRKVI